MADLITRLEGLEREFHEVEARLGDPEIVSDQIKFVELSKRYRDLQEIVENLNELRQAEGDLEAAREDKEPGEARHGIPLREQDANPSPVRPSRSGLSRRSRRRRRPGRGR